MRAPTSLLLACLGLALGTRSALAAPPAARVQLLAFNDFHGQLGPGKQLLGRPAGSAPVLAAYLRDAMARYAGGSVIIHAGDFVGGSPLSSAILQDEPSISFLNLLGNAHCKRGDKPDPRCNVVGTLGNHEFDEGLPELLRLLRGGNAKSGPFLEQPWRGARVPYVSANVIDTARGRSVLPSFTIVQTQGVRIGVIGAVLTATAGMVLAEGIRGVRFDDEATAINRAARALKARGVQTIVVTIHQGAGMLPYDGPTRPDVTLPPESDIAGIVHQLDDAVDVVITGHAHQFSNALEKNAHGHPILVTQAYLAGTAYAAIDLTIDRKRGDVVDKRAVIVPTFADEGPGLAPAADVAALVEKADARTSALLARVVGEAPEPLSQIPNQAGESTLGNLVADAQRSASGAQIALVNQGALRGDLARGPITFGELVAIHPFGSVIVTLDLSGAALRGVLEEQFGQTPPHILQVSGLSYTWDAALPVGKRVAGVRVGKQPLDDNAVYRVSVSDYLARGGGGFTRIAEGKNRQVGARDTEALEAFIKRSGGRASARIERRIVRRD